MTTALFFFSTIALTAHQPLSSIGLTVAARRPGVIGRHFGRRLRWTLYYRRQSAPSISPISISISVIRVETEGVGGGGRGKVEKCRPVRRVTQRKRKTWQGKATYLTHDVLITCHKASNSRGDLRNERFERGVFSRSRSDEYRRGLQQCR